MTRIRFYVEALHRFSLRCVCTTQLIEVISEITVSRQQYWDGDLFPATRGGSSGNDSSNKSSCGVQGPASRLQLH